MRVRQLERLLSQHGAGPAKLDAVTRRLREMGRLPTGARGVFAPDIGAVEAAAILLALAGSSKGAEADLRLRKLEQLTRVPESDGVTLLDRLTRMLEQPRLMADLVELRVGRTTRHAIFVFADRAWDEFHSAGKARHAFDRFYIEGVLPAPLLRKIAEELSSSIREDQRHGTQT